MAFKLPLEDLLSKDYNPAEDSPLRFCANYSQLVEHRDVLRAQFNAPRAHFTAKEQRREEFAQAGKKSEKATLPQRFELTLM